VRVYVIRCADSSLYCGIAVDLKKRLAEHNGEGGSKKGAKYTRSRRPVELVYSKKFKDRSAAMREEARIKAMTRADKLALVSTAKGRARTAGGKAGAKIFAVSANRNKTKQ
jgi:putative endonuclease